MDAQTKSFVVGMVFATMLFLGWFWLAFDWSKPRAYVPAPAEISSLATFTVQDIWDHTNDRFVLTYSQPKEGPAVLVSAERIAPSGKVTPVEYSPQWWARFSEVFAKLILGGMST